MENLDIEKLERKNIYTAPDGFFAEMQMKVLQETAPKKQGKIVKMNWVYSAVAAVSLLFGITFFVTQNNGETEGNTIDNQLAKAENRSATSTLSADEPEKEAVIAYKTLGNDLTNVVADHQKEDKAPVNVSEKTTVKYAKESKPIVSQNPEVQVDQILANFTSAELADLGKNAEQDVYLDLYN
ncbi:hypothetical protein L0B70_05545 [Kaistella sp. 97-N-M2]|uniref:hypothetical protein n=1 Tax=Kaistella sp. 97-N-M2 TaxID=2908645 RepID=UPI001F2ECFE5|nr:hypothetical protein [Kaistella sp. 97-N-M2]UJF30843.1 hypothetical protein L0B70_05545 [Kaistella sp. 97-N-M2]